MKEALVRIRAAGARVIKNEVAYIHVGDRRLQAEVLRVRGATADLQVFEDTRGIRVGMAVDLTGELLSATLGPGLLGQVYDGLQNPLDVLSAHHGNFLERGARADALDADRLWHFEPAVAAGATIRAGETLGHVQEGHVRH
ncbi:MAG: V-type ATP synthase subunit A, partial [Betaproteobacteria bacterium]|nr:V-type ATP synthase subunit A [Betaproteobacteria bacterium]